jgi:hypothetical protein
MKGYQYPAAVRDYSRAKGMAKFLLLTMATYANDDGNCYPSYYRLAQDTGLSLRTVARAIKQIPKNELEVVEEGGSRKERKRQSTIYRILVTNHSQNDHGQAPNRSQNDYGQNGDRSQADHPTVVNLSNDRSQVDHPTIKELSIEPSKARKRSVDCSPSASLRKKQTADPALPPKAKQTADPPIPSSLQTPAFLKAWADFDEHRRNGKARKEWTPRAKELALSECAKLGPAAAVTAIERSIVCGWTGIFLPKENSNHKPKPTRELDEFGMAPL